MVFNANFNNISVISWQSFLWVEKTTNASPIVFLTSIDQDFSYMYDREKFTNKRNLVGKHMALGLAKFT
jgi:hypothetical protein